MVVIIEHLLWSLEGTTRPSSYISVVIKIFKASPRALFRLVNPLENDSMLVEPKVLNENRKDTYSVVRPLR